MYAVGERIHGWVQVGARTITSKGIWCPILTVLGLGKHSSLVKQHTKLPVFDVREVPWGGPGAVEPVAAGPEVAGEDIDDIAPATNTGWAGVLAVVTDIPALGVVIPPVPPW